MSNPILDAIDSLRVVASTDTSITIGTEPKVDRLSTGEEQFKLPITEQELVENPLLNFNDLDECLCGSGHIWRRCHKQSLIQMVPKAEAEQVQKLLDKMAKMKAMKR